MRYLISIFSGFATKLGRGRDNTPVVLCSFMLSKLQYRIGNGLTWRFLDSASVTETVIHLSCCSVRLSGLKSLKKGVFRVTKQIESVTGKDGVSITKRKEAMPMNVFETV